jgi:hypothetical protein
MALWVGGRGGGFCAAVCSGFLLGDGVMEPMWDEAGRLNERMKISEH